MDAYTFSTYLRIRSSTIVYIIISSNRCLLQLTSITYTFICFYFICREHLVPPVPRHGGVWAIALTLLPFLQNALAKAFTTITISDDISNHSLATFPVAKPLML